MHDLAADRAAASEAFTIARRFQQQAADVDHQDDHPDQRDRAQRNDDHRDAALVTVQPAY